MTERQYCERLVDCIISKLPPEIAGVSDHTLNYARRPKYAAQQGCKAYVTPSIPTDLRIAELVTENEPLRERLVRIAQILNKEW